MYDCSHFTLLYTIYIMLHKFSQFPIIPPGFLVQCKSSAIGVQTCSEFRSRGQFSSRKWSLKNFETLETQSEQLNWNAFFIKYSVRFPRQNILHHFNLSKLRKMSISTIIVELLLGTNTTLFDLYTIIIHKIRLGRQCHRQCSYLMCF